jgi:formylglycine-generating enzyme required for sulfatase activity
MIPDYRQYIAFDRAFAAAVGKAIDAAAAKGDRELAQRLARSIAIARLNDRSIPERLEKLAQGLAPGTRVQDPGGPALAYVPAAHGGTSLPAFAFGIDEVTRGEYAAFAKATGRAAAKCGTTLFRRPDWRSPGFDQRDNEPVVCVSAKDADAYARWLSQRTGAKYRLPTRAEWAAMARDAAPRGNVCERANVLDATTGRGIAARYECSDKFEHTAPVGRFPATALGVRDLVGNVREWVSDCAPGSPGCGERTVMGSSWRDGTKRSLVGELAWMDADEGESFVGFRLVREMER